MHYLSDAVTSQAILLRAKQSKRIAELPADPATPRVIMTLHANELRTVADELEKAADTADPTEIAAANKKYASWRFVTGNWIHDMDATLNRCNVDASEEANDS
ncbi:MAG: hypothetical protein J4F28_02190 [Nitrosopumilaceae archaeon]|nr:hypothetical protein [Nitrosopumilaceae archaeon]